MLIIYSVSHADYFLASHVPHTGFFVRHDMVMLMRLYVFVCYFLKFIYLFGSRESMQEARKWLCNEKYSSAETLSSQRDFEMLKIGVCNSSISRFFLEILKFVSYVNDPTCDVTLHNVLLKNHEFFQRVSVELNFLLHKHFKPCLLLMIKLAIILT